MVQLLCTTSITCVDRYTNLSYADIAGISMTKSTAFIVGLICLMGIFIAMYVSDDDTQYGAIITGVVGLTTLYMGASVANNGVKGAFFREELNEHGSDSKR